LNIHANFANFTMPVYFLLVDLGTPRFNFSNWQLPVSRLATPSFQTGNSQFPNWQLPISKPSTPNLQTVNSQFSNCQLDNHSSISIPGHQKLPTSPTSPTSPTELPNLQLSTPSFQTVNWTITPLFPSRGIRNCQLHQLHQLRQLSCQSCNWQLPVSKLSMSTKLFEEKHSCEFRTQVLIATAKRLLRKSTFVYLP